MYSEDEIQSAVQAGVIGQEMVDAIRDYVELARGASSPDEEQVRLITGFNDIFVSLALIMFLGSLASIVVDLTERVFGAKSQALSLAFSGFLIGGAAWLLAEFFTRKRCMALPSILLTVAFVVAIAGGTAALFQNIDETLILAGIAGLAAATAHGFRFRVPIVVALGVGALSIAALLPLTLILTPLYWTLRSQSLISDGTSLVPFGTLILGIGIFSVAMRWDRSDRERRTRRSDVGFWLHLLAAPVIAHSFFVYGGVRIGDALTGNQAVQILLVYVLFALVSLIIDRRALLASALGYVLAAMVMLVQASGVTNSSMSFTVFFIGGGLLVLSAYWGELRSRLVPALPKPIRNLVPPV